LRCFVYTSCPAATLLCQQSENQHQQEKAIGPEKLMGINIVKITTLSSGRNIQTGYAAPVAKTMAIVQRAIPMAQLITWMSVEYAGKRPKLPSHGILAT